MAGAAKKSGALGRMLSLLWNAFERDTGGRFAGVTGDPEEQREEEEEEQEKLLNPKKKPTKNANFGYARRKQSAQEASEAAENANTADAHAAAAKAHRAAAKEAASPSATGGEPDYAASGHHSNMATLHDNAAKMCTANDFGGPDMLPVSPEARQTTVPTPAPTLSSNTWTDAARAASAAARKASDKTGGNSMNGSAAKAAAESTDSHSARDALDAHNEAARLHIAASKQEYSQVNYKAADAHSRAAQAHQKAASLLASTHNTKKCPECGGEIGADGECEDCDYVSNSSCKCGGTCEACVTRNAWSDSAREAAKAARTAGKGAPHSETAHGESEKAFAASDKAMGAKRGASDAHDAAYEAHKSAATEHDKAADAAMKIGNHKAAEAHDEAAVEHRATARRHDRLAGQVSNMAITRNDFGSDEERKAAFAHMAQSDAKASRSASRASSKAVKSGKAEHHAAAAKAHMKAAAHATAAGKDNSEHKKAASFHSKEAKALTKNMSRSEIVRMVANHYGIEPSELALLGRETLNAMARGSMSDEEGVGQASRANDDDDIDDDLDEDAGTGPGNEDDEEQPVDPEANGGKKKQTVNMKQFLDSMPPEARSVWNSAVRVDGEARQALTRKLKAIAANSDQRRKAIIVNRLNSDPRPTLDQLQELLLLVGNSASDDAEPALPPLYIGAAAPVDNADYSDPTEDLPILSLNDLAAEEAAAKK